MASERCWHKMRLTAARSCCMRSETWHSHFFNRAWSVARSVCYEGGLPCSQEQPV